MKSLEITTKAQSTISEIKSLVQASLEGIQKAGELVVDLVRQGYTPKLIASLSGLFTRLDVEHLIKIGERKMNPALMAFTSPGTKYLAAAPIEVQSEVIENGMEVIVRDGDELVKRRLKINELTHAVCKTAFKDGKLLSLAQQKRRVASIEPGAKERRPAWEISDGMLVINRPVQFTKADVRALLRQL